MAILSSKYTPLGVARSNIDKIFGAYPLQGSIDLFSGCLEAYLNKLGDTAGVHISMSSYEGMHSLKIVQFVRDPYRVSSTNSYKLTRPTYEKIKAMIHIEYKEQHA